MSICLVDVLVVKIVVVRVSLAARLPQPRDVKLFWCNRTKWICNYFILSYINLLWFLLNLNTLPLNGMWIHVRARVTNDGVFWFCCRLFFWYVQCGVCCQRTIDQKKYKKHTDTQQALQRHSIVIICYSISFICCENCLGSTESTSRLGRKLYGFDFDTVSLFIVVFLFSICIRYR